MLDFRRWRGARVPLVGRLQQEPRAWKTTSDGEEECEGEMTVICRVLLQFRLSRSRCYGVWV